VENLQFYTSAVAYRRIEPVDERNKAAKKIFEDFIEDNALLQVNINSDVKLKIQKEIENPNQDTFRIAENSIYSLMVADSYPRFLKSAVCGKLVQQIQDEEKQRDVLRKTNFINDGKKK